MNEAKISTQVSTDLANIRKGFMTESIENQQDNLGDIGHTNTNNELRRASSNEELRMSTSASTFTRHTRSIRSIIKDIILGIIAIMEVYVLIRISK